ncbi:3-hydroxyacyl-ACP dehydratase FabZ [Thalassotalea agarivorans]|uniref:3-hydroxyacyl-[acyl-carrier-protein] dehydratase FabZ n=1 Tax=Thalassotalea agarivorans TaxID=349064 RepID=A0A1H9ZVM4_THASX|nr:3-hydroxyacyl-ACP dehydratase FabZ [Thalassotalea agarivorans]SES84904.1 3-hydroxyacyl-[acyl-carrier-protein] dehydratase [Thalassotalea agarivorans]
METTNNVIDIEEIQTLIPHRYPMLLVDRVLDWESGKSLHAIKNITFNEPVFQGHFPSFSIFPGVMILEALAQATGILGFKTHQDQAGKELYLFASIDNARFKKPVVPGDTMHLHVEFIKERRGMWKFYGEAKVDGKVVCSADLMCARREL